MEWRRRFDCDEYCNWLAVGHALSLMCDGVRPYLEQKMKDFQTQLQLAVGAGTNCRCIHSPRRRYNPWHDIVNCKWAAAIQNYFVGNPKKISWHQSNSNVWEDPLNGPWEIAKLFMSDLGPNSHLVTDAKSTDPTGLISLTLRCRYLGIPQLLTEGIRETRNVKWAHAPDQKLSNAEKNNAFASIKDFLKHYEFATTPDVANYPQQIEEFENSDLVFLEERELEVLQDLRNVRENENRQLTETITSIQRSVRNVEELLDRKDRDGDSSFKIIALALFLVLGKLLGEVRRRSKILLALICVICCIKMLGNGVVSEDCAFRFGKVADSSLLEIDFTSSLEVAREHFTGRQWLFRKLEEESVRSEVKGVLILGAPGSGKTPIMAQLICTHTSSILIHSHVIGYHMCMYSNKKTQSASVFVKNLVTMIAIRDKEYGKLIARNSTLKDYLNSLCPLDVAACFRKVVLEPLQHVESERQNFEIKYILIDAVDECIISSLRGECDILTLLRDLLPHIPRFLKFIITSRPMKRLSAFQLHFSRIEIKSLDPKNIEDIDLYVTRRVYDSYSGLLVRTLRILFGIQHRQVVTNFMSTIVSDSDGNFLFAKEVLHSYLTTTSNGYRGRQLPQTLCDIYHKYFERAFSTKQEFQSVQPILEILVASTYPITPEDMMIAIRGTNEEDTESEYEFNLKLNRLSHFLRYDSKKGISLNPKALSGWLTMDENKGSVYYVFKKNGCRKLADLLFFTSKNVTWTSQSILDLAQYISCAGMVERQVRLFKSLPSQAFVRMNTIYGSLLHYAALFYDSRTLNLLAYHVPGILNLSAFHGCDKNRVLFQIHYQILM